MARAKIDRYASSRFLIESEVAPMGRIPSPVARTLAKSKSTRHESRNPVRDFLFVNKTSPERPSHMQIQGQV